MEKKVRKFFKVVIPGSFGSIGSVVFFFAAISRRCTPTALCMHMYGRRRSTELRNPIVRPSPLLHIPPYSTITATTVAAIATVTATTDLIIPVVPLALPLPLLSQT
jgi:hypothetical protein